ncbi:general secretion pathway protein C [Comamonadaceae bacterium OH3737_COT-264]|nr:general secretion pathway protein C [Comamonadaceae bacterium OH3737_COT-264]
MRKPFLQSPWAQRLLTSAVWALAGGSAAFWVLVQPALQDGPPAAVAGQQFWTADAQGLRALLGAKGPAAAAQAPAAAALPDARYDLVGVMAGTASGQGAALIAINGQSARMYRVGAQVGEGGPYLRKLQGRKAYLQPAQGAELELELPAFKPTPPTQPKPGALEPAIKGPMRQGGGHVFTQ